MSYGLSSVEMCVVFPWISSSSTSSKHWIIKFSVKAESKSILFSSSGCTKCSDFGVGAPPNGVTLSLIALGVLLIDLLR